MADFKTHLTIGSAIGFLLASFSFIWHWVDNIAWAVVVFLVTSVGSFLPDVDSDSGLPIKIIFTTLGYFFAGLALYWIYNAGGPWIFAIFVAAAVFFIVYYPVALIFQKYTRHRGIFHSIPAALIAFFVGLLIFRGKEISILTQFSLALGLFLGYFTHLVLDEIWSFRYITDEEGREHLVVKKSFGTALDFGFSGAQGYTGGIISWTLVFVLFLVTLPTLKKIYFALIQ